MSTAERHATPLDITADGLAAIFDSAKLYARSVSMLTSNCHARASAGLPLETELDALSLFVTDFESWLATMDACTQAALAEMRASSRAPEQPADFCGHPIHHDGEI